MDETPFDVYCLKEEIVGYLGELFDDSTSQEDKEKAEKRAKKLIKTLTQARGYEQIADMPYGEIYNKLSAEITE